MQPDPLSQAFEHFHFGRLDEAEEGCRALLSRIPNSAEANHLLGAIRFRQGRNEEALAFLKLAAASPGATAEMQNNLGSVLYKLGQKQKRSSGRWRSSPAMPTRSTISR